MPGGTTSAMISLPRLATVIASLFSFRVVMALATSVTVTGAVSGPLAYKAAEIRAELAAASEVPGPSDPDPDEPGVAAPPVTDPVTGEVIETTTTSSSTTSSTTTPAVTVPGSTTPGTAPATTIPGTTAPTTTRPPDLVPDGLTVALDANRTRTFPLDGYRLFGRLYIYADIPGATSVSYWIDETGPSGTADKTVTSEPFMLGSPLFDTATLGNGTHSLYVRATTAGGTIERYAVIDRVHPCPAPRGSTVPRAVPYDRTFRPSPGTLP